jgi:hypothetical protein
MKRKKNDLILQRVARVGAALVAAAGLAVSSEAVAQHRSAAEALNDPHACWVMQTLRYRGPGEVFWEDVGGPSPGTDHRFDAFVHGRIRPAMSEDDLGSEGIYPKKDFADIRLVEVPCPPIFSGWTSAYFGGEIVSDRGSVRSTERLAATDVVTNEFSDTDTGVGGGFIVGYRFNPWANNIVVSPFASFDFMHASVNHTFPGGSFLGTTANFMGTFGVKAGPQVGAGVWLYGIAGVSVLNETLNINFVPVSSSQSAWVPGGTVGVGGAWQPGFLRGFGRPVSLFAEYQHTWWQNANFNTPTASPFFNYTFARHDDVLKLGFTIPLSAAPPP